MANRTPLSRALVVCALAGAAFVSGLALPTSKQGRAPVTAVGATGQASAPVAATPDVATPPASSAPAAVRAAAPQAASVAAGGWTAQGGASLAGTTAGPSAGGRAAVVRSTGRTAPLAGVVVASAQPQALTTVWVRGDAANAGRQVVLEAADGTTGQRRASAPVTLQPWWQTAALTTSPVAGKVTLGLVAERTGLPAGSTVSLSGPVVAAGGPTQASTRGRVLLVNGQPFVMQGASYWPSAPGGTMWTDPWSDHVGQCATDAQLMRAAGVNTIRIPFLPETYDATKYRQCMDAFAGAGIRLMWLINEATAAQKGAPGPTFVDAYWPVVSQAVNAVKNHPATLGYAIGNEVNYTSKTGGGWYEQLDELARRTKELDPLHVTTTSVSGNQIFDDSYVGMSPTTAPHLDMWGLNTYAWLDGWARGWKYIYDRDPTRPVWFSEWGADRYRCVDPIDTPNGGQCRAGSGEDQRSQADWALRNWLEMKAHLSVADGRGIVGGLVFLWSDAWWMQIIAGGWGAPQTHDVYGQFSGWTKNHFPDGHFSVEWSGIAMIQTAQDTGPRVTTASYDALAWAWTGRPGPGISPVRVENVTSCRAVVRFSTSVPLIGRVDYGPSFLTLAGGVVVADQYVPDAAVQEPGPNGDHTITLTGLLPKTRYSVSARGIDGGGRTASAPTVSFATPAGGC